MIQPLVTLVILIPLIIGILSVDVTGKPTSIREFLRSDMMQNMTGIIENALPSNPPEPPEAFQEPEPEPENVVYLIDIDLTESEKALDEVNRHVAEGITFLLLHVKDFGVYIGVSTAPFHYLVALIVAFLLFPIWNLYIVGFFYIIIKENKEIRSEFKAMRQRKKLQ